MLHIHCGDSSAGTLRQSGMPGEVTVWCDPVVQGPTPAGLSGEAWHRLRAGYLAITAARLTAADVARRLQAEDDALARAPEHDEVVLWFDACLFDQSILICLLDRLSRLPLDKTRLSLICIGDFPGFARFRGLGELHPEQLASLFPTRQPVTPEQIALARRAWEAWTAPEPTALAALARAETAPLPYLGEALARRLEQFPSTTNGLDRLEQEALEAIAEGHDRPFSLFRAVDEREARPFIGDTMLWGLLEELASAETPLVTFDGPGPLPRFDDPPTSLEQWRLSLTPAGRAVLAGREDRIRLNGIDRWVGGVHLSGRGPAWRWHPREQRLVVA